MTSSEREMNGLFSIFSAEDQLLLFCARVEPGRTVEKQIHTLLDRSIDWEDVCTKAAQNRIEPLVHKNLAPRSRERVPDDALTRLADASRKVAFTNLRLDQTLREILDELEEVSIPTIPFKGPALAHLAYGNAAYRQYVDLDLLVQRDDFFRAKAILQSLGYQPYREMDPAEELERVDAQLGYEMVHRETRTVVELHWSFFYEIYAFDLDIDKVWDRHEWFSFAGKPARTLAPEDLMLYLCVHGTKHRFLKLKWLCDVAEFARSTPDLDWETVRERARQTGTERMLLLALHLAHHLLGTGIPASFQEAARTDATLQALCNKLCSEWLFQDPNRTKASPRDIFWFHFRERERLRDRLPYLWHHIKLAAKPSEQDREWLDLPSGLSFLYPFVRPFRLVHDKVTGSSTDQALSR